MHNQVLDCFRLEIMEVQHPNTGRFAAVLSLVGKHQPSGQQALESSRRTTPKAARRG
jgi:hypothetical protein